MVVVVVVVVEDDDDEQSAVGGMGIIHTRTAANGIAADDAMPPFGNIRDRGWP